MQYDVNGKPFNCWRLNDTSIANEDGSDGIYWLDNSSRHLVHLSGWYNRVQVSGDKWDEAATLIGVELALCGDGAYPAKRQTRLDCRAHGALVDCTPS